MWNVASGLSALLEERMKVSRALCPLAQSGQQLKVAAPKVVARYAERTGL